MIKGSPFITLLSIEKKKHRKKQSTNIAGLTFSVRLTLSVPCQPFYFQDILTWRTFSERPLWIRGTFHPCCWSCQIADNRDNCIGVKRLVTRLHIHTPYHCSHTGLVSSVHMTTFPTCTCTIFLCSLSFRLLPCHQSLPTHRPSALQHDLHVTQVTEGWFERVYICSPPGWAGVWHGLGDECHPRK